MVTMFFGLERMKGRGESGLVILDDLDGCYVYTTNSCMGLQGTKRQEEQVGWDITFKIWPDKAGLYTYSYDYII